MSRGTAQKLVKEGKAVAPCGTLNPSFENAVQQYTRTNRPAVNPSDDFVRAVATAVKPKKWKMIEAVDRTIAATM